jgi:predicted RNase H-like HicB family nuclease
MRYPLAIHKDEDSCYGVTVPDIPGCFSAGETIDEAIENAKEAINAHLEIFAEDKIFAPVASKIEDIQDDPVFADATWYLADVDVSAFLGKTEKASVTLPKLVIRKIDRLVSLGHAKSRSSFLADSAIQAMSRHERCC